MAAPYAARISIRKLMPVACSRRLYSAENGRRESDGRYRDYRFTHPQVRERGECLRDKRYLLQKELPRSLGMRQDSTCQARWFDGIENP